MMTLRLEPNAYELTRYYDVPPERIRLDRKTLVAAAAVGAVFAALGLYFATQSFETIDPVVETPVDITFGPVPLPVPPKTKVDDIPPPLDPVETIRTPATPTETFTETTSLTSTTETVTTTGPITPSTTIVTPTTTTAASEPKPAAKARPLVLQPTWVRRPTPEDISRYYPQRAGRLGVQGMAVLSCTVTATGSMSACVVGAESPAGMGFGRAAMDMAPIFMVRPQTEDGAPVGGARVNVSVNFQLR